MNQTGPWLDEASRSILRNLAKALLPLNEWILARGVDGYKPPNADKLPWRKNGASLSIDQLGVIEFVEALLRESDSDVLLLERWHTVEAEPLKYCPLDNKGEWRTARGLSAPRFGAVESQNVLVDDHGNQIARSPFYASYLPLLATAYAKRQPVGDEGWKAFAVDLFKDTCKEWPTSELTRSSRFMLQFLRDLLYAILGVRNPVQEPWRSAVLTEIGEFRRPGNVYTRKDVQRGLEEFKHVIQTYQASKAPQMGVAEELLVATQHVIPGAIQEPIEPPELPASVKAHYLAW